MKTKLFASLFFVAAFGFAVSNVNAQDAVATSGSTNVASMPNIVEAPTNPVATPIAEAPATPAPVAAASQAVPADPCSECDGAVGFGGTGLPGVGLGVRGIGVGSGLSGRFRAARAADHPIVEASPYANPNGSLQDWNRFRYYPYAYYPHNFSDKPNMSVPKYHPGYQNYYPVPRRFHEGSHFHLDVF